MVLVGVFDPGEELQGGGRQFLARIEKDRKSTRLNSSHVEISYAVFCLKKKKKKNIYLKTIFNLNRRIKSNKKTTTLPNKYTKIDKDIHHTLNTNLNITTNLSSRNLPNL